MQSLKSIGRKSQESVVNLVERGREQPEQTTAWAVTAGGALVGALTLGVVAKGTAAVLTVLLSPPVAVAAGALGGGALGWNYMRSRQQGAQSNEVSGVEWSSVADDENLHQTVEVVDSVATGDKSALVSDAMDDLEAINGIGPVYAARLHASGIQTIAQLAELTAEQVQEIVAPLRPASGGDVEQWIEEAQRRVDAE